MIALLLTAFAADATGLALEAFTAELGPQHDPRRALRDAADDRAVRTRRQRAPGGEQCRRRIVGDDGDDASFAGEI